MVRDEEGKDKESCLYFFVFLFCFFSHRLIRLWRSFNLSIFKILLSKNNRSDEEHNQKPVNYFKNFLVFSQVFNQLVENDNHRS